MKKISYFEAAIIFFSGIILLFIIAPILNMFFTTNFHDFVQTVFDPEVSKSVKYTLWLSFAATVLLTPFGIALGYALSRYEFKGKKLISGIINLPIIIPHTAAGVALLGVVSRNTFFGKIADSVGISFVSTPYGIIIGMAFVSVPFLIQSAKIGFDGVPVKYEIAAKTLGASPLRTFFTVSVKMASGSIINGMLLMWGRGMSEFGAVIILAYYPKIMPILVYERFTEFGLKYAKPAALLLIVVCLIFFFILYLFKGKTRHD